MKTVNAYLIILASILIITSCKDGNVKMNTIINEDGTCRREVAHSTTMARERTSPDQDSLWVDGEARFAKLATDLLCVDSMISNDPTFDGDTVTASYYRDFDSVEEMSLNTPLRLNGTPLKSSAKLEKHFRWFYTEYVYTETFASLGSTFPVSPEKYADADTVRFWFTGEPNLIAGLSGAEASNKLEGIEQKMSQWFNDALLTIIFNYIESRYDSISNAPVNKEVFVSMKDSVIQHSNLPVSDAKLAEAFRATYHSDAYDVFFNEATPLGAELSSIVNDKLYPFIFGVTYTLQLPGSEVQTFPLTGERLIPGDYTITATSQVTNIWAWAVSALIILAAIALRLWLPRRKTTGF